MRAWVVALVAMMVLPAVGAAATVYLAGPTPEHLVEGHTVFTVLQARNQTTVNVTRFAAAVAVLVRERNESVSYARFPGVLWFNDQYLVNPFAETKCAKGYETVPTATYDNCAHYRHPCTGTVFAVAAGGANPQNVVFTPAMYTESYHVRDPNDHDWDVDRWDTGTQVVWTVTILNKDPLNYGVPDNGSDDCAPYSDEPKGGPTLLPVNDFPAASPPYQDSGEEEGRVANAGALPGVANPGRHGRGYPCDACAPLQYNALLYLFLDDLVPTGRKDHRDGSADSQDDVAGCQDPDATLYAPGGPPGQAAYVNQWPCPAGNDTREGNSHPYNPEYAYPGLVYDGRGNHGGSADCSGSATWDASCHAVARLDVYYGAMRGNAFPLTRRYAVEDDEGSTAPYHCHDTMATCDPRDVAGAPGYP